MKVLCELDGKQIKCTVIADVGYIAGRQTKIIIYQDKEIEVRNYSGVYLPLK
jgi:hypothetical protein